MYSNNLMMFHFIEVLHIIKGDIDSREQESLYRISVFFSCVTKMSRNFMQFK